ncbi:MAG: Gfo/Idh/MocA family oxidoreductase [Provencibacterium sp.]|jgi:predicted dehydrogenase|nr:Gfo/Idh/MocA family oxidoreductase [Provencibacterium sp.]
MNPVKLGVIGLGNMGSSHLRYLCQMQTVKIAGVCDIIPEKTDRFAQLYQTRAFYSHREMLESGEVQAVIIAVPHYDHVPIAVDAFERGIHVMTEKPITVHVNGAKRMIAAYEKAKERLPKLVFGIMFQERTLPCYRKIKDILQGGELGRLTRVTWINTTWFRSQAYYDSGGWRATWAGEGGGILTNQCPHNLDMYHWLFGMPERVNGFAHIGKFHDIEVEDEVTAYMEHENGMIGHFIVTTGECPGTNRFEIVGENGTLVWHRGEMLLYRNRVSMLDYCRTTNQGFGAVENWETHIPVDMNQPQGHRVVTERFIRSIQTGDIDLIANGTEGLNPVMLANGIMLSSFEERAVYFPLNGDAYEKKLQELIQNSRYEKKTSGSAQIDFEKSLTR